MTESKCPPIEQLKRLLDGSLLEAEANGLQLHLEQCEGCQQQLQQLVADGDFWQTAARELASAPEESPALRNVVDHLEQVPPTVAGTAPDPHETLLPFIEPPQEPGTIGRLKHYDILRVAGRGGMGIVVKAFDRTLRRVVAIKLLAPHLAGNALARQRFVREGRAAAAICHEHVVTIHAVEESPPFLVMQYVQGETLQARIDRLGALDVKETLRIGKQIAEGLSAAHEQGVIHRDIKPANILLENGVARVKLTDFGLARAVDDASLTQSGVVAGTPQYMAPEQANGDAIDERADLFSLGSVLYTMLAGHAPFRASTAMGVLKRLCDDQPRPLREINPDVPDWLLVIINRLHAKRPADRFQSAKELADLLGRGLASLQNSFADPALRRLRDPVAEVHSSTAATAEMPTAGSDAAARGRKWKLGRSIARFCLLLPWIIIAALFAQLSPLESTIVGCVVTAWIALSWAVLAGDFAASESAPPASEGWWSRFVSTLPPTGLGRLAWLTVFAAVIGGTVLSVPILEENYWRDTLGIVQTRQIALAVFGGFVFVLSLLSVIWFRRRRADAQFVFSPRVRVAAPIFSFLGALFFSACLMAILEIDTQQIAALRNNQREKLRALEAARLSASGTAKVSRNSGKLMDSTNPFLSTNSNVDDANTTMGSAADPFAGNGPSPGVSSSVGVTPAGRTFPVRFEFETPVPAGLELLVQSESISSAQQAMPLAQSVNQSQPLMQKLPVGRFRWHLMEAGHSLLSGEGDVKLDRPTTVRIPRVTLKQRLLGRWRATANSLDVAEGMGAGIGNSYVPIEFEFGEKELILTGSDGTVAENMGTLAWTVDESVTPASIDATIRGGTEKLVGIVELTTKIEGSGGFAPPSTVQELRLCWAEATNLRPIDFRGSNQQQVYTLERSSGPALRDKYPPAPLFLGEPVEAVRTKQKRWAERLKVPPASRNSIGMELVLVPSIRYLKLSKSNDAPLRFPEGEPVPGNGDKTEATSRPASNGAGPEYQDPSLPPGVTEVPQPVIPEPFVMSVSPITVAQFRQFVSETDYLTDGLQPKRSSTSPKGPGAWLWRDGRMDWQDGISWDPRTAAEPSSSGTPLDQPVTAVSWNDAVAFCTWLSQKEGRQYRLPNEKEWTAVCQMTGPVPGTAGAEHKGFDAKKPHPLGLQWLGRDEYEWSAETTIGNDRNLRLLLGRGLNADGLVMTTMQRAISEPTFRSNVVGFRVVAEVQALRSPSEDFPQLPTDVFAPEQGTVPGEPLGPFAAPSKAASGSE